MHLLCDALEKQEALEVLGLNGSDLVSGDLPALLACLEKSCPKLRVLSLIGNFLESEAVSVIRVCYILVVAVRSVS